MCILLWTLNNHPKYKFIFAGNRDEFLQRRTVNAEFWPAPYATVLAGRDLEYPSGNGTWLGISTKGRFAALTYYRELPISLSTDVTSRGILTRDFLTGEQDVHEYLNSIEKQKDQFRGYSLLTLDLSTENAGEQKWKMGYFSNREGTEVTELEEKVVHGLSNSVYAKPWPKVIFGRNIMQRILDRNIMDEEELITELFNILGNSEPYTGPETPAVKYEKYQLVIRRGIEIFDFMPDATRTSTVILVDYDGNVVFVERDWWVFEDGKWVEVGENKDRLFRFRIGEEEKVVEVG